MNESRIYVRLSEEELEALYNAALRDYRRPADQARAILRAALLGNQAKEKQGGAVSIPQDTHGAAAAIAG